MRLSSLGSPLGGHLPDSVLTDFPREPAQRSLRSAENFPDCLAEQCEQQRFHVAAKPPPPPQPKRKLATSTKMLLKAKECSLTLLIRFLIHSKERFGVVKNVVIFL